MIVGKVSVSSKASYRKAVGAARRASCKHGGAAVHVGITERGASEQWVLYTGVAPAGVRPMVGGSRCSQRGRRVP